MAFARSSLCLLWAGRSGLPPVLVTTDAQPVLLLGIQPVFVAEDYGLCSLWFIFSLGRIRAQLFYFLI